MFSKEEESKISVFLQTLKDNHNSELEIRFGNFEKKFIPGITLEDWERIKDKHKSFKSFQQKSIDTFYQIGKESYRRTQILNDDQVVDTFWTFKSNKQHVDIVEYNFRVSLSQEEVIRTGDKFTQLEQLIKNSSSVLTRIKDRTTIQISDIIVLDLTIINTGNDIIYEVEIEFKQFIEKSFFLTVLTEFLKIYQNSFYILPSSYKQNVIKEYLSLTKSKNNLIGPQAVSLQIEDLSTISKNYSVTDKLDGERCQMFFNQFGEVFLINPRLKIKKIFEVKNSYFNGTIIDGEYYFEFWAFDLLFLRGQDLREVEKSLFTRLGWIQEIQRFVQKELDPKGKQKSFFHVKNFYSSTDGNIFSMARKILDNKNPKYKLDGLVFTPLEQAIPIKKTWNALYKWKFEELNSIDLKIEKKDISNGFQTWLLYVYNGKNYQLFSPNISGYEKLYLTNIPVKESETYQDDTIVEFILKDKMLKPIRTRTDKTHSNYIDIALSILDNILHPVSSDNLKFLADVANDQINEAINDIIKTKGHVSTQTIDSLVNYNEPFKKMRAFHNQIKKEQITRLVDLYKVKKLLSLGSGKGGDLQKWSASGIEQVIGFDLNPNFTDEACKRYNSLKDSNKINKKLQVKFEIVDLGKETIFNGKQISQWTLDNLKNEDYLFDGVEAQFCLHYFLQSEEQFSNFMLNVISKLRKGGIFYGTILDGKSIHENPEHIIGENDDNNNILFKIEKNYDYNQKFSSLPFYDQQLIVNLKAQTIDKSYEYLVKFEQLVEKLDKMYGLVLVDTKSFSQLPGFKTLDNYEQKYSKLNRTFAFRYRGQTDQKIVSISEALNSIHIDKKPDVSVWSYWTWKVSKNLSGFVYTQQYNQIDKLLAEADLTAMPYIVSEINKDKKLQILSSSFTENIINIKHFIVQGKSQFLIFIKSKDNYYLLAKKEKDSINIFITKQIWSQLDH